MVRTSTSEEENSDIDAEFADLVSLQRRRALFGCPHIRRPIHSIRLVLDVPCNYQCYERNQEEARHRR